MSTPSLFALAVVAFAVELALFCGVGAIAYELVGGGLSGWLAAAGATVAILVFWGLLIAPKARRRLATTPRLVVTALLCVGTADRPGSRAATRGGAGSSASPASRSSPPGRAAAGRPRAAPDRRTDRPNVLSSGPVQHLVRPYAWTMPTMSMNKVIHGAFRRDLDRFVGRPRRLSAGDAARAAALGRAWANFDAQLTDHHEGEHEIAWPHLERAGHRRATCSTRWMPSTR